MREPTEMELRVAQALANNNWPNLTWGAFSVKAKEGLLSDARAAIQAVREPTKDMLAAALPINGGANDDTTSADAALAAEACHALGTPENMMTLGIDGALGLIADWRAMIDAASPPITSGTQTNG